MLGFELLFIFFLNMKMLVSFIAEMASNFD